MAHRLEYAVFRVVFGLFAAIPRSLALRLGAWLGELFYLLDRPDRKVGLTNLRIAFPEKTEAERRRILRASCRNIGRFGAEFCHLPQLDAETISRTVSVADMDRWENIFERGAREGVIILTAHFDNWELLAYLHGMLNRPVTLVHRPMHNALFENAISLIRERPGTRLIRKKEAAKEALRTLKRHQILVMAADQNQTASYGVFVDFFGKPACTTPGPARLAMITGAPILPVFLVREGESERHRIEALPEVELVLTGDRDVDIITNTQRCTKVVEEMIRRYPEQWIWFHRRWKTRPWGEPGIYE